MGKVKVRASVRGEVRVRASVRGEVKVRASVRGKVRVRVTRGHHRIKVKPSMGRD